jgi:hypothetical protein
MFLKPSTLSNILCYLEREKHHWRNGEATQTFNKWPEDAQALVRPFLTGSFPTAEVEEQLRQQLQGMLEKPKPAPLPIAPPITAPDTSEAVEQEVGTDDLLPFPGFAGYAIDSWGRPHGISGKGRKLGPLKAEIRYKPRKDRKSRRFIFGYRLRIGGKQIFKSALLCAIARYNAVRAEYEAQV